MKNYDEKINEIVKLFNMPPNTNDIVFESVYEILKARIGLRLAKGLSNEQLEEIKPLMDGQESTAIFDAMQTIIPDFDRILDEEIQAIKQAIIK